MKKEKMSGTSRIGNREVDARTSMQVGKDAVHKTNRAFWNADGVELLGDIALPNFGAFVSEEYHHLLGDVAGKKILEIGCGTGHSLGYMGERQALELWGLDLSERQIEKANAYLAEKGLTATFICAPMEEECGIPKDTFDIVYSIYAIGWTTDLDRTFSKIASYLKKDGVFIFSWFHPIHKCVAIEDETYVFQKSYFDEDWYSVTLGDGTLTLSDRKVSTYVNALAKAGFVIEEMIEASDIECLEGNDSAFAQKARKMPVTLVVKARKL